MAKLTESDCPIYYRAVDHYNMVQTALGVKRFPDPVMENSAIFAYPHDAWNVKLRDQFGREIHDYWEDGGEIGRPMLPWSVNH